ncbi:uncharacterized protein V1516DRAFT_676360 [Lipomyces oligophaga]|uniref:uncharacterized protein n=1 Tax=Lipomyces oligophaga TaxID=45792 RepID=UPI0034CDA38C
MDSDEEKAQEIELLQSMYPDEMTVLSPSKYTIAIKMEPPTANSNILVKQSNQFLLIAVEYSVDYPQTIPTVDLTLERERIEDDEQEDDDDNKEQRALEIDVELDRNDLQILREKVQQELEENIGLPSIFAVSSSLKDQGETILQDKLTAIEQDREQKLQEEEEREQAKFRGTLVNRENFIIWRKKFRAEMAQQNADLKNVDSRKRPSGREIFEKGLEGSRNDGNEMDEGDESIFNGVKNLVV